MLQESNTAHKRLRLLLCFTTLLASICCAVRRDPPPRMDSFPAIDRGYVDLQAGWRIQTTTPLLKSGNYLPDFKASDDPGRAELSAPQEFIGYETSYYSVVPGKAGGVAVVFVSAENFIGGKGFPQLQPQVRLFDFPVGASFIRIIFLTRVSSADHNQAILAAASPEELDALTRQVKANPSANCKSQGESQCVWIPQGIAVRPEKRDPTHGNNWAPAT
jgi:hypothetical protein